MKATLRARMQPRSQVSREKKPKVQPVDPRGVIRYKSVCSEAMDKAVDNTAASTRTGILFLNANQSHLVISSKAAQSPKQPGLVL
jgi:hypothetical protein